jgi:hypothetical protein
MNAAQVIHSGMPEGSLELPRSDQVKQGTGLGSAGWAGISATSQTWFLLFCHVKDGKPRSTGHKALTTAPDELLDLRYCVSIIRYIISPRIRVACAIQRIRETMTVFFKIEPK